MANFLNRILNALTMSPEERRLDDETRHSATLRPATLDPYCRLAYEDPVGRYFRHRLTREMILVHSSYASGSAFEQFNVVGIQRLNELSDTQIRSDILECEPFGIKPRDTYTVYPRKLMPSIKLEEIRAQYVWLDPTDAVVQHDREFIVFSTACQLALRRFFERREDIASRIQANAVADQPSYEQYQRALAELERQSNRIVGSTAIVIPNGNISPGPMQTQTIPPSQATAANLLEDLRVRAIERNNIIQRATDRQLAPIQVTNNSPMISENTIVVRQSMQLERIGDKLIWPRTGTTINRIEEKEESENTDRFDRIE